MKILENLKKLFKGRTSIMHVKYYVSLDEMILFNWSKCLEGKIQYIRKGIVSDDLEPIEADLKAWDNLYSQYINEYGINPLYRSYLSHGKKLALAQYDYIITGAKYHKNTIRIQLQEVEKIKEQMNKGVSLETILVYLSKWFGNGMLKAKQLTVKEYLTLLKEYERTN